MNITPPNFFTKFFKWFCDPKLYEELQGDLEESFYENLELKGVKKARLIYRKEVLRMIRPSVVHSVNPIPTHIMRLPKNYLKTSLRAIKLNPFYVFANVLGLALALSICTIGYFNYRFNTTFNTYFDQAKNLYKIHGERIGESTLGISAAELAPVLRASSIPSMRYTSKSVSLREGNHLFQSRIAFTDAMFSKYFQFNNLEKEPLSFPAANEIIISESLALKLFNETYPVGQLVKMVLPNQEEKSFIVKDVFTKPPTNTSFVQSAFLSMDNFFEFYQIDPGDWSNWIDGTFVYAENKEELARIEQQLNVLKEAQNFNNSELSITDFRLDNILSWPAFESSLYGRRFRNHLHPSSVAGIAGSAIAILLLACFNFINTSIALSGKRLKEIAVRKIMGGTRNSTISQFLIENTFMITLAVILSFGISYLLIPSYNALFQRELIQLDEVPIKTIAQFSLVLIFIVALLSAAYPSLYISKFSPLLIFRNKVILAGKNRLMAVLLTFQFALCFYNIFGLFLLVDNAYYQETFDRGYDIDQVVNIPLNRPEQYQVFVDHLNQSPLIESVAGANTLVGFSNEQLFLQHNGVDIPVSTIEVGPNYTEALGLRLSKGEFFHNIHSNENHIVVNSMLERELGEDLIGQSLLVGEEKYTVIGVVDDFNLRSIMMDHKITPTIIKHVKEDGYQYAIARINDVPERANREIEKIWYTAFPQELYTGFLQNEVQESVRETNYVMIRINVFIAIITILISVLGLYTLISLKVQKRSKEFGVRKVLGASKGVIMHLLGKDLYWMIGIAAIFGLSVSTIVLGTVFDIIYAYHISPELNHFVMAILVVLLIVVSTIGYKVYQTSRINPVQQLRAE